MEIRILGDFDFAREIISGVARLFSYGNGFGYASGILLVLYLLFLIFKHAHEPERSPNPFKEFAFGIILFLMIGGGSSSAKFDVELISISDPSRFEVINDVPALAAVPAWLASNFLGELREKMESEFTPAEYSIRRGLDPLGAIVRLYERRIPTSYFEKEGEDFARTVYEYMEHCYIADQLLDRAPPDQTLTALKKANMTLNDTVWNALKVSYNGLNTRVYISDSPDELRAYNEPYGVQVECLDAWDRINRRVKVNSDYEGNMKIKGLIGDSETELDSLNAGAQIISQSFTSDANPHALMSNSFLAYLAEKGVHQAGIATESHRMVFEGYNKAVAEKVGTAEVFKKFMVPFTTALETFSFFIAPILMMLAIMGGVGFGYIAKYLGLVLYINLFSFVKVFVDVFTAISIERTFTTMKDTAVSHEMLPATMEQIQGFLATSATLTTSIPLLAMFLLYGSAQTLSGAVKSMSGGGVNPSVMSPEIASTMSGGTAQYGNMSFHLDTNTGAYGHGFNSLNHGSANKINFSDVVSAAGGSAIASAMSASAETRKQAMEGTYDMIAEAAKKSHGEGGSSSNSSTSQKMWQAVQSTIDSVSSATKWDKATATDFVLSAWAGIGNSKDEENDPKANSKPGGKPEKDALGVPLSKNESFMDKATDLAKGGNIVTKGIGAALDYFGVEVGAKASASWSSKDTESISRAHSALQSSQESLSKSELFAKMTQNGETWNAGKEASQTQAYQDTKNKLAAYAESQQVSQNTQNSVNSAASINRSGSIDTLAIAQGMDNRPEVMTNAIGNLTNRFREMVMEEQKSLGGKEIGAVEKSLNALGIDTRNNDKVQIDTSSVYRAISDRSSTSLPGGMSFMSGLSELSSQLNREDGKDFNKSMADTKLNAAAWGSLSDTLHEAGFGASVVDPTRQLSNILSSITGTIEGVANYDAQAGAIKASSPVGNLEVSNNAVEAAYNKVSATAQTGLETTQKDSTANQNIADPNKVRTREDSARIVEAGNWAQNAKGPIDRIIESNNKPEEVGTFSVLSGYQDLGNGSPRIAPSNSQGSDRNNDTLVITSDMNDAIYGRTTGTASADGGGVQAKPTFEGQDLSYQDGRFENLKQGSEVEFGGSSYTLTSEWHRDEMNDSHQVFKSADGDSRFIWNDSSRRMDMLNRD